MSEPLDPFSTAEENRIREMVREELAFAVRRALRSIAYDDLDAAFGVAPPEARQRRSSSHPGRASRRGHAVVDEQAVAASLTDDDPKH